MKRKRELDKLCSKVATGKRKSRVRANATIPKLPTTRRMAIASSLVADAKRSAQRDALSTKASEPAANLTILTIADSKSKFALTFFVHSEQVKSRVLSFIGYWISKDLPGLQSQLTKSTLSWSTQAGLLNLLNAKEITLSVSQLGDLNGLSCKMSTKGILNFRSE